VSRHYTPIFGNVRRSRKIGELPDDACVALYLMLLPQCDAWGRHDGRADVVNAEVWPRRRKTDEETSRCLVELERAGLITFHIGENAMWIQIPDWEEKAGSIGKRDHRTRSEFPASTDSNRIAVSHTRASPGQNGPTRAKTDQNGPSGHAEPDRAEAGQPPARTRGPVRGGARAGALSPSPRREEKRVPPSGAPPAAESAERNGGSHGELDPPPKPATPLTPQQDFVAWFGERFLELRGEPYSHRPADFVQAATLLKRHGREECEARALRMLESEDRFTSKKASPAFLASAWNELTAINGSASTAQIKHAQQKRQTGALGFQDPFPQLAEGARANNP
jgi:hypothetical protein